MAKLIAAHVRDLVHDINRCHDRMYGRTVAAS